MMKLLKDKMEKKMATLSTSNDVKTDNFDAFLSLDKKTQTTKDAEATSYYQEKEAIMDQLYDEIKLCDFVRWTYPSMHGVTLCKIIPGNLSKHFLDGVSCCPSTIAMGTANEIPKIKELSEMGHRNGRLVPDPQTFSKLTWNGHNKYIVGEVICNWKWYDGQPITADSRGTAARLLAKLESYNLKLHSTFEYEFRLFNPNSHEPIAERSDCYSALLAFQNEKFLMDLASGLANAGVQVETMHSELGRGQYEVTMPPCEGLKAADNAFKCRQAVREIAHLHNFMASFMTCPIPEDSSSGCHFNHSLWRFDGTNAMYDANADHGLSDTMLHWIGGLQLHGRALCAFFSPTINCYRRLHGILAPDYLDWDIDNRSVTYRVKGGKEPSSTYLENRQPSACINPYMVLAATVAAGLDGLQRQLKPSARGRLEESQRLPNNLPEAIAALEEDHVLQEILGQEFVDWFVAVKKQVDIAQMGHHVTDRAIAEEIEAERSVYLIYL